MYTYIIYNCYCLLLFSWLSGASSVESSPRDTPTRSRVHRKNERGETPLHLASIKGDTRTAVSLIHQNADVNATDHAG